MYIVDKQDAGDSPDAPQPREMIDMEATFEKLEHELQEVKVNFNLEQSLNFLFLDIHYVLNT
jgi:hypothetical protein